MGEYDCYKCSHYRVCYKMYQWHIRQTNTGLYCPSFERKQRYGEWIEKYKVVSYLDDDVEVYYECSCCGCNSPGQSSYCPNCGAKMKGG